MSLRLFDVEGKELDHVHRKIVKPSIKPRNPKVKCSRVCTSIHALGIFKALCPEQMSVKIQATGRLLSAATSAGPCCRITLHTGEDPEQNPVAAPQHIASLIRHIL